MESDRMDWENGDCMGNLKKGVGATQLGEEEDLLDNDVEF
jgi:hypothetical protein